MGLDTVNLAEGGKRPDDDLAALSAREDVVEVGAHDQGEDGAVVVEAVDELGRALRVGLIERVERERDRERHLVCLLGVSLSCFSRFAAR